VPPPPDVQKTAFIPDHGYYKRSQTYNAAEVLSERTKTVKNNIIWITGEPNNEPFLAILSAIKKTKGIPIYILCGKECQPIRIKRAHDFGFIVYQVEEELEIPYSFFLLDGKLFIDASREHWIWETAEKQIIKANAAWAQELMNASKITH
jgi:ribosomal protein L34